MKFQPLLALGLTILAASTQAFGGATLDAIEPKKNSGRVDGKLSTVLVPQRPEPTRRTSASTWRRSRRGREAGCETAPRNPVLGLCCRWPLEWSLRYLHHNHDPEQARAEVFDFPVEYYASPAVIVVNAKDEHVHNAKDLSGKKVGLTSASSYESYLNKNLVIKKAPKTRSCSTRSKTVQVAPYDTDNVAFQDLGLGAGSSTGRDSH